MFGISNNQCWTSDLGEQRFLFSLRVNTALGEYFELHGTAF